MIMRLTDPPKSLVAMKPDTAWPARVQAVMDRALERDANARFPTALEFGYALNEAVKEMPAFAEGAAGTLVMGAATTAVPATRVSPVGRAAPAASAEPVKTRRRTPILVGGGLAAVLLLGGAMYASRRDESPAVRLDTAAAARTAADSVAPTQLSTPLPAAPGPEAVVPAARSTLPAAVVPVPRVSYAAQLLAIWESVTGPESARQAQQRLKTYRSKVRTRADSAVVALIDGKAALLTGGATRGCSILRRIDSLALSESMQTELREGLQNCEGS
jgi:hypothetical protein